MTFTHGRSFFFFYLQASENDGLPPIVCVKCREQLDSCHRFRRAAHRTQQALLDYLQFTSKLNGTPQVSFKFFTFNDFSSLFFTEKSPHRWVVCISYILILFKLFNTRYTSTLMLLFSPPWHHRHRESVYMQLWKLLQAAACFSRKG